MATERRGDTGYRTLITVAAIVIVVAGLKLASSILLPVLVAAFLAVIALIPSMVAIWLKIPFFVSAFLGGTGLLIVVSVALDFVQRIEANLIMRNYKGFLGGS